MYFINQYTPVPISKQLIYVVSELEQACTNSQKGYIGVLKKQNRPVLIHRKDIQGSYKIEQACSILQKGMYSSPYLLTFYNLAIKKSRSKRCDSFSALCQMLGCSPYESSLAPIICMVGAILFAQKQNTYSKSIKAAKSIAYSF